MWMYIYIFICSACLSSVDIRNVLLLVDPHKSVSDLDSYLYRGTQDIYMLDETETELEEFVDKLCATGLVHYTGHWKAINTEIGSTNQTGTGTGTGSGTVHPKSSSLPKSTIPTGTGTGTHLTHPDRLGPAAGNRQKRAGIHIKL